MFRFQKQMKRKKKRVSSKNSIPTFLFFSFPPKNRQYTLRDYIYIVDIPFCSTLVDVCVYIYHTTTTSLMMGAPLQNVTSNADARPPFHFLPVGSARHRFNKLKREIINVPLYDVYTLFLCAACVSCYFTHKRPRWSEWVGTSVCCNICLMCCCFFSYSFSRGICIHFFF